MTWASTSCCGTRSGAARLVLVVETLATVIYLVGIDLVLYLPAALRSASSIRSCSPAALLEVVGRIRDRCADETISLACGTAGFGGGTSAGLRRRRLEGGFGAIPRIACSPWSVSHLSPRASAIWQS